VNESPESVTPLLAPIDALQKLISHFGDRGTIIGGIAASLLGKPRLTADLDVVFLLSINEIPELIKAAETEGLTPRFEADYQAAVAALESVKPEEWRQGGKFFDEGFYTVEKLLATCLSHIQEHAATLRQLLETGGS
jgi:hypothetical protein